MVERHTVMKLKIITIIKRRLMNVITTLVTMATQVLTAEDLVKAGQMTIMAIIQTRAPTTII